MSCTSLVQISWQHLWSSPVAHATLRVPGSPFRSVRGVGLPLLWAASRRVNRAEQGLEWVVFRARGIRGKNKHETGTWEVSSENLDAWYTSLVRQTSTRAKSQMLTHMSQQGSQQMNPWWKPSTATRLHTSRTGREFFRKFIGSFLLANIFVFLPGVLPYRSSCDQCDQRLQRGKGD